MTEITLHLSDEQARQLAGEAVQRKTTPEAIATRLLVAALAFERVAAPEAHEEQAATISEEQFLESLDRTIQENLELLKRLA